MDHRRPAVGHPGRGRVLAAALLSIVLLAGCARESAAYPHGNEQDTWTDGSVVRTVLLFVVVPVGVAALIAALAWLPGTTRGSRYRPQYGWSAPPVWFAGPPDPVAAVEQAEAGDVRRGGAGGSW